MKLWGGRFEKGTDKAMDAFHSSIAFDARLYKEDITGSIAHAAMLGKQGIIPKADADAIIAGLKALEEDIENGKVAFSESAEDIQPKHIYEIMELLRQRYDYVIIDTPHNFDSVTISALDHADQILVVLTLEIHAIRSTRRLR
jgi:cellulose biosynthesis protein BcsQ